MNINDKYYIGSTKDIKYRIARHKSDCYNKNSKQNYYNVYKYIRDNIKDWSEVSFDILDVYDDISDDFKREMEQYYMEYFSNNLNMKRAKYDKNIYNKKRNEKRKNDDEYRNKINDNRRLKYNNDEEYRNKINEKQRLKLQNDEEYRNKINENRRLKLQNDEEYRNKRNEIRREKVECECGIIVNRYNIKRHRKSKKHKELLNK